MESHEPLKTCTKRGRKEEGVGGQQRKERVSIFYIVSAAVRWRRLCNCCCTGDACVTFNCKSFSSYLLFFNPKAACLPLVLHMTPCRHKAMPPPCLHWNCCKVHRMIPVLHVFFFQYAFYPSILTAWVYFCAVHLAA